MLNNYIKFSDNTKVDHIKIENKVYNDINEMLQEEDERANTTILLNNFVSEIDAYYFSQSTLFKNTLCSIYKKTYAQPYFSYVCTLKDTVQLTDYNIHNHDYYEYLAVIAMPKSGGRYVYQLYENKDDHDKIVYSNTNWGSWSICNIEETDDENIYVKTGNAWILGLNLNEEKLTQNLSVTSWDTLSKYPKLSLGERDYISSTVTCLLGKMEEITVSEDPDASKDYRYTERINQSSTYQEPINHEQKLIFADSIYSREIEKYEEWVEFCSDGSLKLLKDLKGNAWIVQITSSPEASYNTQVNGIPTTVTFSWSEVMSADNISIIG